MTVVWARLWGTAFDLRFAICWYNTGYAVATSNGIKVARHADACFGSGKKSSRYPGDELVLTKAAHRQ